MSRYYRSLLIGGLDPIVTAFISANGVIDTTYINALNTMVLGFKSNSIFSKIQCWHIFYGDANKSKYNLLNPLDSDAGYRLTFSGGGTFSTNGYLTNGTNAYANSHFIPSAVQDVNSNGMTIISGTNNIPAVVDPVDIGTFNGASQASLLFVKNSSSAGGRMNSTNYLVANADAKGVYSLNKQTSTLMKLAKNGSVIGSSATGGTLSPLAVYIGNLNLTGSAYGAGWSNQRIQQTLIHSGLSDTETATMHTLLDNFENALGRKTW